MLKFILSSSCLICTLFASYPEYKEFNAQGLKGDGSYKDFFHKINKREIKTIFEVGSRDAKDALELSELFKCHVFAFECNPIAIEICRENIGLNPNVTLISMGVWDKGGEISFYSISEGNIGASSFFEFNPEARNYPSIVEEGLVQEEITVPCTRLDDFLKLNEIDGIDLLCMDVQGASYQVLRSLGDQLSKVKYIIVELETHPIYFGEVLYQDVNDFITNSGFIMISDPLDLGGLFGDVLYINSSLTELSDL